jgi:hypothetical protein
VTLRSRRCRESTLLWRQLAPRGLSAVDVECVAAVSELFHAEVSTTASH